MITDFSRKHEKSGAPEGVIEKHIGNSKFGGTRKLLMKTWKARYHLMSPLIFINLKCISFLFLISPP
jgi:hypothetical protein